MRNKDTNQSPASQSRGSDWLLGSDTQLHNNSYLFIGELLICKRCKRKKIRSIAAKLIEMLKAELKNESKRAKMAKGVWI